MAINFDGVNDYYGKGSGAEALRTVPLICCFWTRITSGANMTPYEENGAGSSAKNFPLGALAARKSRMYNRFSGGADTWDGDAAIGSDVWTLIVWLFDGLSTGTPTLYYNGVDQAITEFASAGGTIIQDQTYFRVGANRSAGQDYDGNLAYLFRGTTDDIDVSITDALANGVNIFPLMIMLGAIFCYPLLYDTGVAEQQAWFDQSLKTTARTGTPSHFDGNPPVELLENYL